MPKRGETRPFKVQFRYPNGVGGKAPHPSEESALFTGRGIARRGAKVEVFHIDPETKVRTDIAAYDENNEPPEDDSDLV